MKSHRQCMIRAAAVFIFVGVGRIELPLQDPQPCVLPLYYTPPPPAKADFGGQCPLKPAPAGNITTSLNILYIL